MFLSLLGLKNDKHKIRYHQEHSPYSNFAYWSIHPGKSNSIMDKGMTNSCWRLVMEGKEISTIHKTYIINVISSVKFHFMGLSRKYFSKTPQARKWRAKLGPGPLGLCGEYCISDYLYGQYYIHMKGNRVYKMESVDPVSPEGPRHFGVLNLEIRYYIQIKGNSE